MNKFAMCSHERVTKSNFRAAPTGLRHLLWLLTQGFAPLHPGLFSLAPPGPASRVPVHSTRNSLKASRAAQDDRSVMLRIQRQDATALLLKSCPFKTRPLPQAAKVWCSRNSLKNNRGSFDFVWPKDRPNFAQEDSSFGLRMSESGR